MNVLTAAWAGAGSPTPPTVGVGSCARCAQVAALVLARSVVSKVFTGYDDWVCPSGTGLCPACAWGYATASLRGTAHLITRDPATLDGAGRQGVYALLTAGALGPDVAVVVPLRPGRKHLLPGATWGRVTLDDAQLPWTTQDAHRLGAVAELRAHGFGTRMLTQSCPPFSVLRRLPRRAWPHVMATWQTVDIWRVPASPWLPLALHITHKETR